MFAAEFEPAHDGRRRSPRSAVSLDGDVGADVGLGGLARALCKVVDVSTHGARLATYSPLRKGMAILLTLPAIGPITADVMWADDFSAGCQFRLPLAPDLIEHLTKRDGTVAAH